MGNEVSHPLPLHTPFRLQLLPVSERGNLINITWRCLSVCSVGLTGGVLVISYMHRIIVNSIESTFISRSIPLTPSVCCLRASDAAAGRSLPLPECHCQGQGQGLCQSKCQCFCCHCQCYCHCYCNVTMSSAMTSHCCSCYCRSHTATYSLRHDFIVWLRQPIT